MPLTKEDVVYRDSAHARIVTRAWIAIILGVFASWFWLFVLTAIWAVAEFVTMHKVLSHPVSLTDAEFKQLYSEKERRLKSARAFGEALVGASAAWVSVVVLAAAVKGVKLAILTVL